MKLRFVVTLESTDEIKDGFSKPDPEMIADIIDAGLTSTESYNSGIREVNVTEIKEQQP